MIPTKTVIMQAEYWLSIAGQTTGSRRVWEIVSSLRRKVDALRVYRYEGQEWQQDSADELKTQIMGEAHQMLEVLAEYDDQAFEFCRKRKYLCGQAEKLRERGMCTGRYYLCYVADWVLIQAEQLCITETLFAEVQEVLDVCGRMEVQSGTR